MHGHGYAQETDVATNKKDDSRSYRPQMRTTGTGEGHTGVYESM